MDQPQNPPEQRVEVIGNSESALVFSSLPKFTKEHGHTPLLPIYGFEANTPLTGVRGILLKRPMLADARLADLCRIGGVERSLILGTTGGAPKPEPHTLFGLGLAFRGPKGVTRAFFYEDCEVFQDGVEMYADVPVTMEAVTIRYQRVQDITAALQSLVVRARTLPAAPLVR